MPGFITDHTSSIFLFHNLLSSPSLVTPREKIRMLRAVLLAVQISVIQKQGGTEWESKWRRAFTIAYFSSVLQIIKKIYLSSCTDAQFYFIHIIVFVFKPVSSVSTLSAALLPPQSWYCAVSASLILEFLYRTYSRHPACVQLCSTSHPVMTACHSNKTQLHTGTGSYIMDGESMQHMSPELPWSPYYVFTTWADLDTQQFTIIRCALHIYAKLSNFFEMSITAKRFPFHWGMICDRKGVSPSYVKSFQEAKQWMF